MGSEPFAFAFVLIAAFVAAVIVGMKQFQAGRTRRSKLWYGIAIVIMLIFFATYGGSLDFHFPLG
jgi:uncharacterized membrane protein